MGQSKIQFTVYPEERLTRGKAEGQLTFNDLNWHTSELLNHQDFALGFRAVYDFLNVDRIVGDPNVFEDISEKLLALGEGPVRVRVALVIGDNPLLEGTFRGWKIMMSFSALHYETFSDIETAERWVKADDRQ